MTIQYQPNVIYTFAERLYRRAQTVAALYGLLGAIIGGLAGLVLGLQLDWPLLCAGIGLCAGTAAGTAFGIEKGFALRLQAQQALCHVKVEEHARYLAEAAYAWSNTGSAPRQSIVRGAQA